MKRQHSLLSLFQLWRRKNFVLDTRHSCILLKKAGDWHQSIFLAEEDKQLPKKNTFKSRLFIYLFALLWLLGEVRREKNKGPLTNSITSVVQCSSCNSVEMVAKAGFHPSGAPETIPASQSIATSALSKVPVLWPYPSTYGSSFRREKIYDFGVPNSIYSKPGKVTDYFFSKATTTKITTWIFCLY